MFGKLLLPFKVIAIFTSLHIMYIVCTKFSHVFAFCIAMCIWQFQLLVIFLFHYYWHIKNRPLSVCKWLFGFNDVYFVAWCFLDLVVVWGCVLIVQTCLQCIVKDMKLCLRSACSMKFPFVYVNFLFTSNVIIRVHPN